MIDMGDSGGTHWKSLVFPEQAFDDRKCFLWFKSYTTTEDRDTIQPEGVMKLCADLGLNRASLQMIILAWKMQARRRDYITRKEWHKGFGALNCDGLNKLKRMLPYLPTFLEEPDFCREIYRFSFNFAKEPGSTTLPIADAKRILDSILRNRWPLWPKFLQFLDVTHYRFMTQDQWNNLFEFSSEFKNGVSGYDPYDAWPVLMDDFVEWMNQNDGSAQ